MITEIILVIALILIIIRYRSKTKNLRKEIRELASKLKSSEVKFGKAFEHYVPFIKDFPGEKKRVIFLGMPVDYVSFALYIFKFLDFFYIRSYSYISINQSCAYALMV